MQLQGQFDTGVDVGRNDTALRRAEPGRSGVRSLAARVLTVALLATLAALAALPAPPLQAQTVTTTGQQQASDCRVRWQLHLSSSELRNGRQRGWLHGLRGWYKSCYWLRQKYQCQDQGGR